MRPPACLSLDLDNQWSYMKTHGDEGWESFPSYLDLFVPRILHFLAERKLTITFFVVGQDAALEKNREALVAIAEAGHEIANHSFNHEPWLHLYSREEIDRDIGRAEEAIERATGRRPVGFRGPGFSHSWKTLEVLVDRGYRYDASTFPTFIGPLARAYYFRTTRLSPSQTARRKLLFGRFSEGFRPLNPYRWRLEGGSVVEVPVTTMPILRTPIHISYLLYLDTYSSTLARAYFGSALRLCRATRVLPSLLLHPLDFLGGEDVESLSFFPAMKRSAPAKLRAVDSFLQILSRHFQVAPLIESVSRLAVDTELAERTPDRARGAVELSVPPQEESPGVP